MSRDPRDPNGLTHSFPSRRASDLDQRPPPQDERESCSPSFVTGRGIGSSIGSNKAEVLEALRAGRSGIEFCDTYAEIGFRSHVHGSLKVDLDTHVDRKVQRFMGAGAAYNYVAMPQSIT